MTLFLQYKSSLLTFGKDVFTETSKTNFEHFHSLFFAMAADKFFFGNCL